MTRFIAISAVVLPALLAACAKTSEPPAETPSTPKMQVEVQKTGSQQAADLYVATATVRGRTTAVLTSKAMGYVKKLHAQAGDDVHKGDVLVELDSRDAKASIAQARAAIAQAEAAIVRAESDLKAAHVDRNMAEVTWQRTRKLAEKNAVTDQQRDQAESALDAAKAREQIAEATVAASRSQLQQARANREMAAAHLDYREVRAPFDGRVVQRNVDVGDLASPGTPLLTLEDMTRLRAEAVVDESQAGHIQLGQETRVDVEAADVHVTGTVAEIVPAVDVVSRAFIVKVDIPAQSGPQRVQPGMFARVRFPVGESDRLVVPKSALSRRGSLERVFVFENGLARLRLVTSGLANDGEVEILSGLSPGEQVIVKAPRELADATPVEVTR